MKYVTKPKYDKIIASLEGSEAYLKAVKSAASIISINAKLYTKYVSNPAYKALSDKGLSDKS